MTLTGRSSIVTGGGRGIGKAVALGLAAAGATVGVTDLDEESARITAEEIQAAGGRAHDAQLDVADCASIDRVFADLIPKMGGLDILVNAAGIQTTTACIDYTPENWDRQLDVNLRGTFFCCQAAAREMIPQRRGKIVSVASTSGFVASRNPKAAYDTSKGGVRQLTVALGSELGAFGINVNAVAPGTIFTEMTRPILSSPELRDRTLERIPLGRIGETADVVGPVVFLCSPESDYIAGHTLVVDGGWLL